MFWHRNRTSFGRLAAAAILVTTAASAAANVLVVRSFGPSAQSYPPGRSLPDDARIALRAGDTLVVLGSGGTRTFRGPGNFSPSAAVRAGVQTASVGDRRARIGAVRNAGLVPRSPTLWHVDVSQGGDFCIADTGAVMLWRPEASTTETLGIAPPGGTMQTVEWPAGQTVLQLPAAMAVADGAEYSFRQAGVAVPTRITFRTLDSEPTDLQAVAEALIEKGCETQLDLLVDTAPETPTG